jgi:hypothetical protein
MRLPLYTRCVDTHFSQPATKNVFQSTIRLSTQPVAKLCRESARRKTLRHRRLLRRRGWASSSRALLSPTFAEDKGQNHSLHGDSTPPQLQRLHDVGQKGWSWGFLTRGYGRRCAGADGGPWARLIGGGGPWARLIGGKPAPRNHQTHGARGHGKGSCKVTACAQAAQLAGGVCPPTSFSNSPWRDAPPPAPPFCSPEYDMGTRS